MVVGVNLTISAKDIADALKSLQAYRNRDKNVIYLTLDFTRTNILDWHKEISDFVYDKMLDHTPKKGRKEKVTKANMRDAFMINTNQVYREDAANTSILLLKDIEKRYNSEQPRRFPRFRKQLRELFNKSDLARLTEIKYLIGSSDPAAKLDFGHDFEVVAQERLKMGFLYQAKWDTDLINFENIMKGEGTKPDHDQLRTWIDTLRILQQRISDQVIIFTLKLNCQQKVVEALRKKILEKRPVR
jgi:hypothetical protein